MKREFDVLQRDESIFVSRILEASAGTGKTFTIEHLVIRALLVEHPVRKRPIDLSEILVVTFTRAAASDLRARIYKQLVSTLSILKEEKIKDMPDYLLAIMEGDLDKAKRRLKRALLMFDEASIMTIHGFCSKILFENCLEGNFGLNLNEDENQISEQAIRKIVRNFFRSEKASLPFSKGQFVRLLSFFRNRFTELENRLVQVITMGAQIASREDFTHYFCQFNKALERFPKIDSAKVMEDFLKQASAYRGLCPRQSNQPREQDLIKVKTLATLLERKKASVEDFDQQIIDQLFLMHALDPTKQKMRAPLPFLHYPELVHELRETLWPVVKEASEPAHIFALIAYHCKQLFTQQLRDEDRFSFDDLLLFMDESVKNPLIKKKLLQTFSYVVIDEFQDTDPLQWNIFRDCFLDDPQTDTTVVFVGDPKQSIYGFRQADIYTYLQATSYFQPAQQQTLSTNYRAQENLVMGLNLLFSEAKFLFPLPREKSFLPFNPVKFSNLAKEKSFLDGHQGIHFWVISDGDTEKVNELERDYFFPSLSETIQYLHQRESISLKEMAILVKDRFQAKRVEHYLKACGIPTLIQRTENLADSNVCRAFRDILQSVRYPQSDSDLKTALCSCLIGLDFQQLEDDAFITNVSNRWYLLHQVLFEKGLGAFFQELIDTPITEDDPSIAQLLMRKQKGRELYEEWVQLMEVLLESFPDPTSIDQIVTFLDVDMKNKEPYLLRQDVNREAIHILTIHMSKGLEYEVVFPLGLIVRTPRPSTLIPSFKEGKVALVPSSDEKALVPFLEELDAEKMRQFYVALTRAKFRLYLPVHISQQDKKPESGSASPMELFLEKLGSDPTSSLDAIVKKNPQHFQLIKNGVRPGIRAFDPNAPIPGLTPPPGVHFNFTDSFTYSFSQMARVKKMNHDLHLPTDLQEQERTVHTLPAGANTGTLIHSLLETIPFAYGESWDQLFEAVKKPLKGTMYEEWDQVIARMLFKTLNQPLGPKNICLKTVSNDACYREMEFLYPTLEGSYKGVIDYILCDDNTFYIIDWKTNWLGPSPDYYSQSHLNEAMETHDYFLQAKIYKDALNLYIKNWVKKPLEKVFGGVFYLFLRGIDGTERGIYFIKPGDLS